MSLLSKKHCALQVEDVEGGFLVPCEISLQWIRWLRQPWWMRLDLIFAHEAEQARLGLLVYPGWAWPERRAVGAKRAPPVVLVATWALRRAWLRVRG